MLQTTGILLVAIVFVYNLHNSIGLLVSNDSTEKQLQDIRNQLQVITHDYKSELESTKEELRGVKDELRDAEENIRKLQKELNSNNITELKMELEYLKVKDNATQIEIKSLRNDLRHAQDEILNLTARNSCVDSNLTKVISDIYSINGTLKHWIILSEEIQDAKRELRQAEADIFNLTKRFDNIHISTNDQMSDLSIQVKNIQSLYHNLSSGLNASFSESNKTRGHLENLRIEMLKHAHLLNQTLLNVDNITSIFDALGALSGSPSLGAPDVLKLNTLLPALEANLSALWNWMVENTSLGSEALLQNTVEDVAILKDDLSNLQGQGCCSLFQNVTDFISKMQTDVAFEVNQSKRRSGFKTLTFDTVLLNDGGGYDSTSGFFVAPISGTYLLWANIDIFYGGNDYNEVYLVKGNTVESIGYAEISPSIDHNVISVMSAVYLRKNESVHYEMMAEYFAVEGGGRSSYGGTLLRVH